MMTMWKMALVVIFLTGCAETCQFGKVGDDSGLKCIGTLKQAEVGMTPKEVENAIGLPQQRRTDVTYRGKNYPEVWVYDTDPKTVVYFKAGVVDRKEYQQ